MTTVETATRILDTMLGHLALAATMKRWRKPTTGRACKSAEPTARRSSAAMATGSITSMSSTASCGGSFPKRSASRWTASISAASREDQGLADEIKEIAARVKETGKPHQLRPLNAYYRRMVHNLLINDPEMKPTRRRVTTV